MSQTAESLRQGFIRYFQGYEHHAVPSAPLIPQADPTILFTNAGMNQFKRVFLGEEKRPYKRAVTAQKCLRAGGKHNDLENVGYTRRHHTFFEMLGNFSFGDYFKSDAIFYGWDYLTKTVGLPKDRLWVTVFRDDDEAFKLWEKIGMPVSRIVRCDEKDNFWQMADTGPCGPCSEIHYDQGPSVPGDATPNGEGDRVIEIWNLVFMQFERDAKGTLNPLPKPSIDTGMGLERLAAVAQGVHSNYDSDLFKPLLAAIGTRAGRRYGEEGVADRSMRVIADHLRAITFMITDGILPSNEGRGYVLRRILRRAARHGRLLGVSESFMGGLTGAVVEQMGKAYPELRQAAATVAEVTQGEEERFIATLDQGLPILNDMVAKAKSSSHNVLAGEQAFKLYDTYGFPMDLIAEACREQGMAVDEAGFQRALDEQRERARKATAFEVAAAKPGVVELAKTVRAPKFIGYDQLDAEAVVQAMLKGDRVVREAAEGDEIELVLDVTPFYAEGGGQAGDQGVLTGPEGRIDIKDTTRPAPTVVVHKGRVAVGRIGTGETVRASVNATTRHDAARNHTATHLVHAALRELLGPHVKQYGSLVAPNRLRFDFAHFRPLSSRDTDDIESMVNAQIRKNQAVRTDVMGVQEAVAAGALAFFGDKYGDQVRVVSVDTFSRELCGGTHCRQTGEIGVFRLVSETGVAAGVRRIECVTGSGAFMQIKQLEHEVKELSELLKAAPSELVARTKRLLAQLKDTERELEQVKLKMASGAKDEATVRTVNGVQVHAQRVDGMEGDELRTLADQIRDRLKSGVVALGGVKDDKVSLLVVVTKDLTATLKAGELIKVMAAAVGGTGGGRPEMAQAGGKNPEGLATALEKIFALVEQSTGK
ncbi:MAG: alanine--tRNA ligase [Nitrospiraceae bacterium]|nr:alanine--tRNA ligase [Nitrospiraceae bacterium]MSR23529.1 alanine--tRNA ligase [Nitrospiraceae bacterium]